MPSDFESKEPSLVIEEVERREEPRGLLHGIDVLLPGGLVARVVEAARRGVFCEVDRPDDFALGGELDVRVRGTPLRAPATQGSGPIRAAVAPSPPGPVEVSCRVEVIRKEIHPRRGLALRILRMSAASEQTYLAMIGA
jgi:hypothetical protein